MDFGLTEEQQQLKDSARNFLSRECPTTRVRAVMADDVGMPRDLYQQIANLGWNGLIVPEKFGGAGLGMLDMSVLLEECGYAALPGPFLFSSVLAASALAGGGSEDVNDRWLGPLAEGRAIGTVAVVEANDSINPADLSTTARKSGSGWVLNGAKMFVPYAHVADFVIVVARTGPGAHDIALFLVEPDTSGFHIRRLNNLDMTRRIGKPIGSYQALQHAAAEIVADLEPARSLLWYAAHAQDVLSNDAPRAAAMVKARMCDVCMRSADRAVLMHGGIGFTWDHDMHLWFKRARFNESYFGAPATLSGY